MDWARRLLSHDDCGPVQLEALDATLTSVPRGSEGCFFFPYFDGTSPFDRIGLSQGSLLGLSLLHDHRHVLRAVAEGVAYAARLMLEAYSTSLGRPITPPIVVGGATRSGEWMQLLADILGTDLSVSSEPDSACVGAAMLAATATGAARDVRSSVRSLACPRTLRRADPTASRLYDELYIEFHRHAGALSCLYADTSADASAPSDAR
jgi:xylulokinase